MPATPDLAWHQQMSLKASGALLVASSVLLTGCGSDEREPLPGNTTSAYASCGDVEFQPKSDAQGNFGYKVTPHSVTENAELVTYIIQWDKDPKNQSVPLHNAEHEIDGDPYFHAYKKPGTYTISVAGEFKDLTKKEDPNASDEELRKSRILALCGGKTVKITKAQIKLAKEIKDSPYQWPDLDNQFES